MDVKVIKTDIHNFDHQYTMKVVDSKIIEDRDENSITLELDNINKVCRVCLRQSKSKPLDESNDYATFNILIQASQKYVQNVTYPNNICYECSIELNNITTFINKLKTSTRHLNMLLIDSYQNSDNESEVYETEMYLSEKEDLNNLNSLADENNTYQKNLITKQSDEVKSTTKLYECHNCGKIFENSTELSKHKLSYKFECQLCDKHFVFRTNLTRHVTIVHKQIKKYSCQECGEKFTAKNSLKYHSYIHTNLKPFLCDLCPKAFRQPMPLLRHKRAKHAKDNKLHAAN